MTEIKAKAVQTAGERLERLEVWMRRCFIAMTACAVLLAVLASIGVYGVIDYMRLKWALGQASREIQTHLTDYRQPQPAVPWHAAQTEVRR